MKKILLLVGALLMGISALIIRTTGTNKEESVVVTNSRVTLKYPEYKKLTIQTGYKAIHPDVVFENLHMPGKVGRFGVGGDVAKFTRALRFKDITDAVENRYDLPPGIIFAMMVEESTGADLLPNGLNDGGFGLCHMQPAVACDFNLKTYMNCNAMVCNGKDDRSCVVNGVKQNHAKDLKDLIVANGYDRKKVIKYDDRLNPIKNLDAVGRMLASYMDGPSVTLKNGTELGPFRTALCRYAGRYNYQEYWHDVRKTMVLLEDTAFMHSVEEKFNAMNPDLTIDGNLGSFKLYIQVNQEQNENYGVDEYKKLQKYEPKNAKAVLATYRNFL